jgi:hypothetical protein
LVKMVSDNLNKFYNFDTRGFYGGSAITRTYCPLNGRFKFTYSINDGTEDDLECHEPVSEAGDCPSGYKFDLHFRGCSFPNFGETVLTFKFLSTDSTVADQSTHNLKTKGSNRAALTAIDIMTNKIKFQKCKETAVILTLAPWAQD